MVIKKTGHCCCVVQLFLQGLVHVLTVAERVNQNLLQFVCR